LKINLVYSRIRKNSDGINLKIDKVIGVVQ
jgi:hypothetical protein